MSIVINVSSKKEGAVSTEPRRYEVVSVSLPRELVRRANALIPKTRRSRVITRVLASFLDAVERQRVAEEYRAYYAQRTDREAEEERALLAEWQVSDAEAWAILEEEDRRGRRPSR
jgi:metal-responsive CopG/Arc/MetJ family transcriptional regulator